MDHLTRLQDFFRSLFQFDLADLDFGLYRLFHLKRSEIEAFITEQLPHEVDAAFAEVSAEDRARLQEELESLKAQVKEQISEDAILPTGELKPEYRQSNIKVVRELTDQYETTRQQVQALQITEGHKAEVFNHLVNFFSRYYEDGDFIPKRRYGARETYAVPYHGEEVFFHWANRGQHYVKTAERFRDYAFKLRDLTGEYRVRFTMTEASIPKDNTKGNRRYFFPRPDSATYDAETREFTLPFEYRLPTPEEAERYGTNSKAQEAILEEALPRILEAVPESSLHALLSKPVDESEDAPTMLLKRLRHFCRRNTSDYFIHKDLRGFLTRELEFYIKDQIIHLMDLEADLDAKRRVVRTFRKLAERVIDFLATIEDAQKTLFEKRKFVLETDYLIPIRHVPREFWPEILQNEGQLEEWRCWLALEPQKDLFNPQGEVNEAFLEAHPTLPVHTKHFDRDFVRRLLEALPFDDLDEATDGLLVHGENYQALRLLHERYREQVRCIYIDPPYNSPSTEIIYKNNYKHSSWVTLMFERLRISKSFLQKGGTIAVAIDDHEVINLKEIMSLIFPGEMETVAVRSNPAGRSTPKGFSLQHEYVIFSWNGEGSNVVGRLQYSEEQARRYKEKDEIGPFEWVNFRKHGGLRKESSKMFYPIFVNLKEKSWRIPEMDWSNERKEWIILEEHSKDEVILWPIDEHGQERRWKWSVERLLANRDEVKVDIDRHGDVALYIKSRMPSTGKTPPTWWDKKEYSATDWGTRTLKNLFGELGLFDYPKAVELVKDCLRVGSVSNSDLVFDYFSGSGTTGHAVINLNREDGGQRKFILVEMGEYFDTVLLPRIAKVMYTPEWRDGVPKREATPEEVERTPRLVKIIRIESYEDALHNLAAPSTLERAAEHEEAYKALAGEDAYRLRYWIELPLREAETCLRTFNLTHPFAYSLEILTDNGPVHKPVDVVETFNYLYGLRVKRYETWRNPEDSNREYRVVKATDREGRRRILVLWRDMDNLDVEAERSFLEAKIAEMEAGGEIWDEILINGDSPTPGIASLDPLFKRLMMQGEEG
jgi:adenine-specific DNA-methyltransferase